VVYGTSTGTGVEQLVDETNKKFDFKLLKIAGGNGPSDHASFYLKQIPVLFFFTGTHKDYHRPSDTPDKINAVGLLRVVDFVQVFADHYTTITDRPKYLAVKGGSEDPTNPNPTPGRVSIPKIKFTPGNYGEEGKGVLVEAVEEGGPAAKGGMKAGDFIVEVAGQSVKSMDGYMAVMQTVVAEKPVEIVVLRKNEKVKLIVVPWK
jgi:membrane-associated protease RseP (regulator of RpoE activity)